MGFVAVIVGFYLLSVVKADKTDDFVKLVSDSGGFLKWFLAVAILWRLNREPELKPLVGPLITMAFVAFVMLNVGKLEQQFSTVWKGLD